MSGRRRGRGGGDGGHVQEQVGAAAVDGGLGVLGPVVGERGAGAPEEGEVVDVTGQVAARDGRPVVRPRGLAVGSINISLRDPESATADSPGGEVRDEARVVVG